MIRVTRFYDFCEQGSRDNQEDFIVVPEKDKEDPRVFVLCDGMGGHGHGEVASQTVATAVAEYLNALSTNYYLPEQLQEALNYAVERIEEVDKNYNDAKRMGTTLVVVVVNNDNVIVGHVGDSRCYLIGKDCKIRFRTKDHSEVQQAVDLGFITEDKAWDHPKKNIITQCVQAGRGGIKLTIDILEDIYADDSLFLCTDGVNDALRDTDIVKALLVGDDMITLKEQCARLSHDNYSGILIKLYSDNQPKIEAPLPPINIVYCPHCGAENKETAKFCIDCGENMIIVPSSIKTENTISILGISMSVNAFRKISLATLGFLISVCVVLMCVISHHNKNEKEGDVSKNIEQLQNENKELKDKIIKLESELDEYNRLRKIRLKVEVSEPSTPELFKCDSCNYEICLEKGTDTICTKCNKKL